MVGLLTFALSTHSRTCKSGELKWQSSIYGDIFRWIFNSNEGRKSCNELWIASSIPLILLTNVLMDIVWIFLFLLDGPDSVTLSPPTTTYTVVEGDAIPSISCTASCRPQCTFMWTGPNVPDRTTNDLFLQNINRNQSGTFYCTATNEVGSKRSSSVVVDVRCKLILY